MYTKPTLKSSAFSLVELVIVVAILGIITAVAVPRFADAGSGRRLTAARSAIYSDVELIKLRARATSKPHAIKFYPSENKYIVVEGIDINRRSIVLTRDLDDDPFNINLDRTNIGGDEILTINALGELSPASTLQINDDGVTFNVELEGLSDNGLVPTLTITTEEALAASALSLVRSQ
ncbi:MAG: Tfp pilus assembly protein FimT/FimU [Phycisphaerales bacterium]